MDLPNTTLSPEASRRAAERARAAIAEDIAWLNAGADPHGCCPAGSERAEALGFDSERFEGYLWLDGATCWLSLVVSREPGRGHFSALLQRIASQGYAIRVPNPTSDMQARLARRGFEPAQDDPLTWCLPVSTGAVSEPAASQ